MRLHYTLSFSREERQVLERAALSIRIAFGDPPDRNDAKEWKAYPGRALLAVAGSGQDRLSPEQVHGAYEAVRTLRGILEEQSHREYWEAELRPREGEQIAVTETAPGGPVMGLVAPGTEVCGMLAETRIGQYREACSAEALLATAVMLIGPPDQTEDRD